MTTNFSLTGYITITDIVNGRLVTCKYQGHTLRQAKKKFKELINKVKHEN